MLHFQDVFLNEYCLYAAAKVDEGHHHHQGGHHGGTSLPEIDQCDYEMRK